MDAFADKLGRVGAWCGQNKYLNAIKNAFQNLCQLQSQVPLVFFGQTF